MRCGQSGPTCRRQPSGRLLDLHQTVKMFSLSARVRRPPPRVTKPEAPRSRPGVVPSRPVAEVTRSQDASLPTCSVPEPPRSRGGHRRRSTKRSTRQHNARRAGVPCVHVGVANPLVNEGARGTRGSGRLGRVVFDRRGADVRAWSVPGGVRGPAALDARPNNHQLEGKSSRSRSILDGPLPLECDVSRTIARDRPPQTGCCHAPRAARSWLVATGRPREQYE